MNNLKEIQGYYGVSRPTPTTIFVYEKRNGEKWYAVEGSTNINCTYDEIKTGTNVEELSDCDTIGADNPVNSLEDLEREVDE
jgi:hypothetical protein